MDKLDIIKKFDAHTKKVIANKEKQEREEMTYILDIVETFEKEITRLLDLQACILNMKKICKFYDILNEYAYDFHVENNKVSLIIQVDNFFTIWLCLDDGKFYNDKRCYNIDEIKNYYSFKEQIKKALPSFEKHEKIVYERLESYLKQNELND